jgi:hypothetical protein
VRIGRYDAWSEYDAVAAVMGGHSEALTLAKSSADANHMIQCWNIAKESLLAYGCTPGQAEQLLSVTKDLRQLSDCKDLDPNVHVLRAYIGRCAYRARLRLQSWPTIESEDCIGSGIIIVEPGTLGLTQSQRDDLEAELSDGRGSLSKNNNNLVYGRNGYDNCTAVLAGITPFLSQVTGHSESIITEELSRTAFAQSVINGPHDNDIQKVLHQDTWFDAWKLWYFPRDVKHGDGPFRYARYSHGLSSARLRLAKEFATPGKTWESWRSAGHDEGSWRVSDDELLQMGCGSNDITCHAGTLVLANVFGYHARGEAIETKERIALHASIRLNPWKN